MTARGCGSSRQTLRNAENSTAAASPTVPRKSARSAAGSMPLRRLTMLEANSQVRGQANARSFDCGSNWCRSSGRKLHEEDHLGRDAASGGPGAPVGGVDLDLEVNEARRQRRRHAVHDAAVGLAVAAGDERGALGQFVLADLAVEHQLVERGLHHRHCRRQLLQVDEKAAGIVRRRQEGRRRPARAVRRVPPGDAAEVDGVEQECADVDVPAVRLGRDLLGDLRLGGPGRAPDDAGLASFDQEREVEASSLGRSV